MVSRYLFSISVAIILGTAVVPNPVRLDILISIPVHFVL